MRIIGIDPGTATTGFSIIEKINGKLQLLDYGCIRTPAGLKQSERLNQIAEDLATILKKWEPEAAAVEKLFFEKNVKTAISVAEARGVVLQKLGEKALNVNEFTPLQIKSAVCGYGQADKKMVQKMVQLTFNLDHIPQPDDAADAIATGICLAQALKYQQMSA